MVPGDFIMLLYCDALDLAGAPSHVRIRAFSVMSWGVRIRADFVD